MALSVTYSFSANTKILSAEVNQNFQDLVGAAMDKTGDTMTGDLTLGQGVDIIFEGATDDDFETTLRVVDPTADRTISLPNASGTVAVSGSPGVMAPTFTIVNLSDAASQLVFDSDGNAGTLTWTPSTTRTLTLPDATDTLVGKATTDTLTNKSIDFGTNTITATTAQMNAAITDGDMPTTAADNTWTGTNIFAKTSGTGLEVDQGAGANSVISLGNDSGGVETLITTSNTGLFSIGADNGITISTATGSITLGSNTDLNGTMTVAGATSLGSAAVAGLALVDITGTFTSDASGVKAVGLLLDATVTGGDTGDVTLSGAEINPTLTFASATTGTLCAGLNVQTPTINLTGGSTVATAATLYVEGAPASGTNKYALYVDDGGVRIDSAGPHGIGTAPSAAFGLYQAGSFTASGGSSCFGFLQAIDVQAGTGHTTEQSLTAMGGQYGATISTQDNSATIALVTTLSLSEPNISKGATDTITNAATLYIKNAPTEAGTGNYALWVDSGVVRWDDGIADGGGSIVTLGNTGGSGPSTAAQAQWLRVNIAGTTHFIPVWT